MIDIDWARSKGSPSEKERAVLTAALAALLTEDVAAKPTSGQSSWGRGGAWESRTRQMAGNPVGTGGWSRPGWVEDHVPNPFAPYAWDRSP